MIRLIFEAALLFVAIYSSVRYWRARKMTFRDELSRVKNDCDKLTRDHGRLEERLKRLLRSAGALENKPTEQPINYEKTG